MDEEMREDEGTGRQVMRAWGGTGDGWKWEGRRVPVQCGEEMGRDLRYS